MKIIDGASNGMTLSVDQDELRAIKCSLGEAIEVIEPCVFESRMGLATEEVRRKRASGVFRDRGLGVPPSDGVHQGGDKGRSGRSRRHSRWLTWDRHCACPKMEPLPISMVELFVQTEHGMSSTNSFDNERLR